MRNILEIARLIRVLEDDTISKSDKIKNIKMVRNNGHITEDEALELVIDYFTK